MIFWFWDKKRPSTALKKKCAYLIFMILYQKLQLRSRILLLKKIISGFRLSARIRIKATLMICKICKYLIIFYQFSQLPQLTKWALSSDLLSISYSKYATLLFTGIASAFGAPVGGLLFAMEEVSSFWNMKMSWQVPGTNTHTQTCSHTHTHSLSLTTVGGLQFAIEEAFPF